MMFKYLGITIFVATFVLAVLSEENISEEPSLDIVARGEVQSCRGCQLNRLHDVKNFIYSDLPKYTGVEFNPIQGAVPQLVLFDESDKELERIDLSPLSREKCNELVSKWFRLKEEESDSASKDDVREEL